MMPAAAPAAAAAASAPASNAASGPPAGPAATRPPAAPPTIANPVVPSGPVPTGRVPTGRLPATRASTPAPYDAEADPDSQPDAVVDTLTERRPRSKLRAFLGLLAVVLVGAAIAGGVVFLPKWLTPKYAVPDLHDVEIATAENQIAPNGWKVEKTSRNDENIAANHIISQIPEPGVKMKKGKTISFVVSDGPAPRAVPDLTGKSGDEAKQLLDALGLVYNEAGKIYDETAPPGTVMSFTVGGQPVTSPVLKGAQVDVTVSNGPAPRTIPKLVGKTLADAKAALEAIQLVANPAAEEFSDMVPAGIVTSLDPKAGQTIDRGGTVNITVSKGPDVVTVPNVIGMTLADATAQLNGAGLAVGDVAGPPDGHVTATGPSGGAVLKRNSVVNLLLQ
jgi:serine/threonine-protein kinase